MHSMIIHEGKIFHKSPYDPTFGGENFYELLTTHTI